MSKDLKLQQDVLDELDWDPKVDAAHIGVAASDGSVTLSGHVGNYPAKYAAANAARRVRGVRAIADEIKVHLPSEFRRDDSDIAERIAHVLEWNISVPSEGIQAKVSGGFVTLSGEVDWEFQRRQVEKQVRHVAGVTGVSNAIKIKERANVPDIKAKIENALQRHAKLETSRVRVTVDGDKVTLDGDVSAIFERDLIERAAWTAPGVRHVVDHLHVV